MSKPERSHLKYVWPYKYSQDSYRQKSIEGISVLKYKFDSDSVIYQVRLDHRERFNEKGLLVSYHAYRKGKIKTVYQIKYDSLDRPSIVKRSESKPFSTRVSQYQYTYYNDTLLSNIDIFQDNHVYQSHYVYDAENRLIKEDHTVRKEKREKSVLRYRWEYDYYPNGNKKETRNYDRKNKLTQTYRYDCNINSDPIKKHKDTSSFCSSTDTLENGYIRRISEYTSAKGKIYRRVWDYHPKTHHAIDRHYDANGDLTYEAIQTKTDSSTFRYDIQQQVGWFNRMAHYVSINSYDPIGSNNFYYRHGHGAVLYQHEYIFRQE